MQERFRIILHRSGLRVFRYEFAFGTSDLAILPADPLEGLRVLIFCIVDEMTDLMHGDILYVRGESFHVLIVETDIDIEVDALDIRSEHFFGHSSDPLADDRISLRLSAVRRVLYGYLSAQ